MTNTLSKTAGYIHSIETCGTADGPGIRFIIFTSGCPLRCLYCCNPDCRHLEDGKLVTVDELIEEIQKYIPYMQASGGGVNACGGEPLFQPQFVREIFKRCHELKIHTALDTSGFCELNVAKPVLEYTDLVLLDIKSFDASTYHKVTGVNIEPTLTLARYLNQIHKPVWIRFVLVPGLTDDPQNIAGLADFLATLTNIERVDVLPFHKMGEYKWEQLGYDYQLKDTPNPTSEQVQAAIDIFKSRNLNAM
ncbi:MULTISPECIES: pyruvate formate-lyase-activating protein [Leptolyngbya]|jgi:pyruvate formate lyase activating enzyme|uniref:Pyruvate formate-lyase-activating enzyme n=3 Tax=Leptolyngbya boryana TaxID=1184 RepID=A0A1Z4JL01_LEPBY|nr:MULTISPECIES: pyruvate formate-lyase-activating protein [Leptolyngbya]BAO73190.1 pyruvate formate-lyase activating enzyme [Leptolyngbya boryana]BAY57401.1 pyruvate formate-lyase activating enzyme [Leptolyngbya boryana NIES-2135]MBD1859120.1 pyruvate formate lyase-activating protein [Leptolyngbya sp. FACHB-1624]MBD2368659.1 pyruvate formate lyase-activating protein [Leptolyngbya sp. FACHB-161]MBD2375080.1 pyruvate formate lyase-activating protein [Leptolyngbya sp. FACHB-238]